MMNSSSAKNVITEALHATRAGFLTAMFFSFFINLLAFVGPLYMLQIYDRVITSRNLTTLAALTIIAAFLLLVYALLEKIRSAILVRLGVVFSATARPRLFEAVSKACLLQPGGAPTQALRDLEFHSGIPHRQWLDRILRCSLGSRFCGGVLHLAQLVWVHRHCRRLCDPLSCIGERAAHAGAT